MARQYLSGLSCDVPSHVYAYSFELKGDWSHRFSPAPRSRPTSRAWRGAASNGFRFHSEITRAEHRDGRWRLTAADGAIDIVDFVICATGVLHHPA